MLRSHRELLLISFACSSINKSKGLSFGKYWLLVIWAFGIRRHGWAPTSVLVEDVVLVVASPLCLREITMLERLPHKMIFVVCPRAP